jgi:hypothetical protein
MREFHLCQAGHTDQEKLDDRRNETDRWDLVLDQGAGDGLWIYVAMDDQKGAARHSDQRGSDRGDVKERQHGQHPLARAQLVRRGQNRLEHV